MKNNNRTIPSLLIENLDILFGFFWAVSMVISLVEVYVYQGVIIKHTGLDPRIVYGLTLLIGLFYRFFSVKVEGRIVPVLSKVNYLGIIISVSALIVLNIIEEIQYPNYVFTKIHIHPAGLIIPFVILLTAQLILLPADRAEKITWYLFRPKLIVTILVTLIIVSNIYKLGNLLADDFVYIFKKPFAQHDEKMIKKLGDNFYKFTNFIIDNTPAESTILIPPQGFPWPRTGNLAYFRYFLYPRTLINGKEYESGVNIYKENVDYVLLAWGETTATEYGFTHGWPKFDVDSEEILVFKKNEEVEVIEEKYKYEDFSNLPVWGLIKVKK